MNENVFTLIILLGLALVFTAAVMLGRAWMSRKVGDSPTLRQMERGAIRYARISIRVGLALTGVGLVGWLMTR